MCERYVCNLSEELLKKAQAELNEPTDNDERLKAMDELRTRFQEQSGLDLIRSDDAFILRFLRVKKFDQDRAYECLLNYHIKRQDFPQLYEKVNQPSKMSAFLDRGIVLSLGNITNDGSYVMLIRPGYNGEYSNPEDILATVILTVEHILENEAAQINGITVIDDFQYSKMQSVIKWVASPYVNVGPVIMQEAMPVRIKNVRMLNEGIVIDVIWSIISKFLKEKIKKRIQFLGSEYEKLHELCPRDKLPEDLHGTGASLDASKWKQELLSTIGGGENTDL